MKNCVTIKSVTVEAMRFLFYGWVLRDIPCGKSIVKHENVSCGNQDQYGTINMITLAHYSGSNPDFATDPDIRSVPFVIECKFNTLHLKTIRPFLQVQKYKNFYVDPCTINMCTKLYGSGGAFSDLEYIRIWMKRIEAAVDMVTIYLLDNKVPMHTLSLLQKYSNVNLVVWNSSFTKNEYHVQSESADSEIEGTYRSAIDHCAMQSVSKFGWVLIMDLDEVLYVPNKKRLCEIQRKSNMISFPTLQWMSNAILCPYMYDVAKNASNSISIRHQIQHKSAYFDNAFGWKGMMTPMMKSFYFSAHISSGALTPPDVAFLTHRNHRASCQDECCCRNSPCDFAETL